MSELRCAFLTMSDTDGWEIDSDLAIPWLQRLGWRVDTIEWRQRDVDWTGFDAVYLGTPWDYPSDPATFLEILGQIDRCGAILINELDLVHWNIDKSYLKELQNLGAPIVPTSWFANATELGLGSLFDHYDTEKLIVKPVVSTNASNTYLLNRGDVHKALPEIDSVFANRAFMVQPYISNIEEEGEYSLFYIDGVLSHTIRKLPTDGDFRVQEEHGASLELIEPDVALAETSSMVLDLVTPQPVYARCDFVRTDGVRYLLMEMELIEPSMYLRMGPGAAARFATAIDARARKILTSRAALTTS